MTFTEKMILSGIVLWALMRLCRSNYKLKGIEPKDWMFKLGGAGMFFSITFSVFWIWSQ